jgi:phosphoglycerate dehydrogenase-like enzyme
VDFVPVPPDQPIGPGVRGDVLLARFWGRPDLAPLLDRGVRWMHVLSMGVDRFPLHLAEGRLVTCSRGANAVPVAEWAFAMLLAFEKRLPGSWVQVAPARWGATVPLGTLAGKRLGLVGVGAIGQQLARRAHAFDLEVLAVRRSDHAPPEGIGLAASLPDLFARSDHVVVAAPATAETHHLIDAEVLAASAPGLHLVNISRGSLVDQDALREALDAGLLAGASLDTVDPEPLPPDHWMYRHPGVRLSPHVAWSSPSSRDRLVGAFSDNLRRWLDGEALEGVVAPAAGF